MLGIGMHYMMVVYLVTNLAMYIFADLASIKRPCVDCGGYGALQSARLEG